MTEQRIHPAIREELEMLQQRFPGKQELTMDDYAEYWCISRHYVTQHLSRLNKRHPKLDYKRVGRRFIFPMLEFAYFLAQCKVVNGAPIMLSTSEDLKDSMKRRRGFSSKPSYNYRSLG